MLRLFKSNGKMFGAVIVIIKCDEDELCEFQYQVSDFDSQWYDEGYIADETNLEYCKMIWKKDYAIIMD